jgi:2-polyprenyl-3-methyl-5-hydroxy-6-metoxy-1,4-benzoquinol methylase
MARAEIEEFVKTRSWYQTIKLDDKLTTNGCEWCGELAWENISTFLPPSLEGKRVLDLGCNAGLFCVKAALMGAKEVVGVDWPGWRPNWNFREQQLFIRKYFEEKYNRPLRITYMAEKMEDVLKTNIGHFDYVFAIK